MAYLVKSFGCNMWARTRQLQFALILTYKRLSRSFSPCPGLKADSRIQTEAQTLFSYTLPRKFSSPNRRSPTTSTNSEFEFPPNNLPSFVPSVSMSAQRLAERFPAVYGSQRPNAPSKSIALGREKMKDMAWAATGELEQERSVALADGILVREKMWGAVVSLKADGEETLALIEAWFNVSLPCTDPRLVN